MPPLVEMPAGCLEIECERDALLGEVLCLRRRLEWLRRQVFDRDTLRSRRLRTPCGILPHSVHPSRRGDAFTTTGTRRLGVEPKCSRCNLGKFDLFGQSGRDTGSAYTRLAAHSLGTRSAHPRGESRTQRTVGDLFPNPTRGSGGWRPLASHKAFCVRPLDWLATISSRCSNSVIPRPRLSRLCSLFI